MYRPEGVSFEHFPFFFFKIFKAAKVGLKARDMSKATLYKIFYVRNDVSKQLECFWEDFSLPQDLSGFPKWSSGISLQGMKPSWVCQKPPGADDLAFCFQIWERSRPLRATSHISHAARNLEDFLSYFRFPSQQASFWLTLGWLEPRGLFSCPGFRFAIDRYLWKDFLE